MDEIERILSKNSYEKKLKKINRLEKLKLFLMTMFHPHFFELFTLLWRICVAWFWFALLGVTFPVLIAAILEKIVFRVTFSEPVGIGIIVFFALILWFIPAYVLPIWISIRLHFLKK